MYVESYYDYSERMGQFLEQLWIAPDLRLHSYCTRVSTPKNLLFQSVRHKNVFLV